VVWFVCRVLGSLQVCTCGSCAGCAGACRSVSKIWCVCTCCPITSRPSSGFKVAYVELLLEQVQEMLTIDQA
jgi:hypothetical protein